MAVRMTTLVLFGLCLAGAPALGQGMHHYGPSPAGGNPWSAPDARGGGVMPFAPAGPPSLGPGSFDPTAVTPAGGMMPPGMMPPGMMPPGMMPPGPMPPGMMPPGGIVPTGGMMMPPGAMPPHGLPPGAPVGNGPTDACPTGQCQSDGRSWADAARDMDDRMYDMLRWQFQGSHVRLEWLNYEIEDPGTVLLGEQPTTVPDPTSPFLAFDLQNPANVVGTATVPTTGSILLRDISGSRLVYSTPVAAGDFEISGWVTEQASDQFIQLPLPLNEFGQPQFLATSTLVNGAPANNFQFYDTTYNLEYTSELWGAGAKLLLEGTQPNIVRLRPSVGWRYFSVQESFSQNATFVQTSLFTPSLPNTLQHSQIRSQVYNNVMGLELGFQAEAQWWIFAVGVEPAITLGPNFYKARTVSNNFVSVTDPERIVETTRSTFSPVLELGAYARVRVMENVELRAGYDMMYFTRVQRPARGIIYDIDGATNTSLVRPDRDLQTMAVDGLSLSLVVHFPVCCDSSDGWRR